MRLTKRRGRFGSIHGEGRTEGRRKGKTGRKEGPGRGGGREGGIGWREEVVVVVAVPYHCQLCTVVLLCRSRRTRRDRTNPPLAASRAARRAPPPLPRRTCARLARGSDCLAAGSMPRPWARARPGLVGAGTASRPLSRSGILFDTFHGLVRSPGAWCRGGCAGPEHQTQAPRPWRVPAVYEVWMAHRSEDTQSAKSRHFRCDTSVGRVRGLFAGVRTMRPSSVIAQTRRSAPVLPRSATAKPEARINWWYDYQIWCQFLVLELWCAPWIVRDCFRYASVFIESLWCPIRLYCPNENKFKKSQNTKSETEYEMSWMSIWRCVQNLHIPRGTSAFRFASTFAWIFSWREGSCTLDIPGAFNETSLQDAEKFLFRNPLKSFNIDRISLFDQAGTAGRTSIAVHHRNRHGSNWVGFEFWVGLSYGH